MQPYNKPLIDPSGNGLNQETGLRSCGSDEFSLFFVESDETAQEMQVREALLQFAKRPGSIGTADSAGIP